ncbi:hypothetical protein AURDEDRAFT_37619, partial [Auricularia subglabra TFB-10046 SS5]
NFKLELPSELKSKGVHPMFHASLLRVHIPNDDRRFPGRSADQVLNLGGPQNEFEVSEITEHSGAGREALFKVNWKSGDST